MFEKITQRRFVSNTGWIVGSLAAALVLWGGCTTPTSSGGSGGTGSDGSVWVPQEDGTQPPPPKSCESATECPPEAPICSAAGTCIECESDEECEAGLPCTAGFCQVCTPGAQRCTGSAVERCDDTGSGWVVLETCPANLPCTNGQCLACYPGTKTCEGNASMECMVDGSGYVQLQDCAASGSMCTLGVCVSACSGDLKQNTNAGCEFYAVDLENATSLDNDAQNAQFAVIVSNTSPTTAADVTLTRPDGNKDLATVPAMSLHKFELPPSWSIQGTGVTSNAFQISSTQPITVYQFNPLSNVVEVFSNDASVLLPTPSFGNEYVVMSYSFAPGVGSGSELPSYFTVVASSSNPTEVTFTVSAATRAGNGIPALAAGQSHTLVMEQGQVLNVAGQTVTDDLTGSRIVATGPVGVFGGHVCPFTSNLCCCDHLEQQMIPVSTWGKDYVISKAQERWNEQDYVRVLATENNTQISLNPPIALIPTLNAGQHYTFQTLANVQVSADKPILVAQYLASSYEILGMPNVLGCFTNTDCPTGFTCDFLNQFCLGPSCSTDANCGPGTTCELDPNGFGGGNCAPIGDPAMILAVSKGQFMKSYVFLTPDAYLEDYLNVIAPMDVTSITLDGVQLPVAQLQAVGTSGYGVYRTVLGDGIHRIESDKAIGIVVYGYDNDVSYGYPGGMGLVELNP